MNRRPSSEAKKSTQPLVVELSIQVYMKTRRVKGGKGEVPRDVSDGIQHLQRLHWKLPSRDSVTVLHRLDFALHCSQCSRHG
jgi:hypothetical protein